MVNLFGWGASLVAGPGGAVAGPGAASVGEVLVGGGLEDELADRGGPGLGGRDAEPTGEPIEALGLRARTTWCARSPNSAAHGYPMLAVFGLSILVYLGLSVLLQPVATRAEYVRLRAPHLER